MKDYKRAKNNELCVGSLYTLEFGPTSFARISYPENVVYVFMGYVNNRIYFFDLKSCKKTYILQNDQVDIYLLLNLRGGVNKLAGVV